MKLPRIAKVTLFVYVLAVVVIVLDIYVWRI